MKHLLGGLSVLLLPVLAGAARNPVIHADVPDMAMIRVGDAYCMQKSTGGSG